MYFFSITYVFFTIFVFLLREYHIKPARRTRGLIEIRNS